MSRKEFLTAYRAVVERALSFNSVARREGLLALEALLDNEKVAARDIFEYGMRFIVDGTDWEFVDQILSNLIDQVDYDYESHCLRIVKKEAVKAIQYGISNHLLVALLNSYSDLPLSDPVFKTE